MSTDWPSQRRPGSASSTRPATAARAGSTQTGTTADSRADQQGEGHARSGRATERHRPRPPREADLGDGTGRGQLVGRQHPQQEGDRGGVGHHDDVAEPVGDRMAAHDLVEPVPTVHVGEAHRCQHDLRVGGVPEPLHDRVCRRRSVR